MPSACLIDAAGEVLVGEQTQSRPGRLRFVKRYWQNRPEDQGSNPWREVLSHRGVTYEKVVKCIIGEAFVRALNATEAGGGGFSANIVCPLTFDLTHRHTLHRILLDHGAKSVTLSNVVDEPMAAAILYGKVATTPPVNKDLLVFDAGAGTVDMAIVRYHEEGDWKKVTVLAEAGRCCAGADLELALQQLIIEKISAVAGGSEKKDIHTAYGRGDQSLGRVLFEEECEQIKIHLAGSTVYPWNRVDFLGHPELAFEVTREEFSRASANVLSQIKCALQALFNEAQSFVENFDGIDIALLVGGTSKLPMVRDIVTAMCLGAVIHRDDVYFDEMLATARGIGFTKDFEDLVIKRPPYTTEIRATFADGTAQSKSVHEAFDRIYPWWRAYQTSLPYKEVNFDFDDAIESLEVFFISPSGGRHAAQIARDAFRGKNRLRARLDVRANLRLEATGAKSISIRMPYFTQVGLKPQPPFEPGRLNLPDVYPAEN